MEEYKIKEKKINGKKIIIGILLILIITASLTIFIMYCENVNFRKWVDINILRKEIKEGDTISIEFDGENSLNVYAFDKYIVTLESKVLKIYNSLGTEETSITTTINNPIFDASGRYLAIAEENGEDFYLLEGKQMLWHNTAEGEILQIEINENGYVGVVISDISYENIINVYNIEGKSLFKTYVATNKVIDISISKNNQYLAIAEIDLSGVVTQSSIKIIDIARAQTDPNNSIVYTYSAEIGKLIINIEYQNRERLLCSYNDSIDVIKEQNNKEFIKLKNTKIIFASLELKNNVVTVKEKDVGEYGTSSSVDITDVTNNKVKTYETEGIAKEVYTFGKIIALNLGSELHIINTNGWLMKKYISNQEINNVVISNKIAGIIYRDKIEIIDI